MSHFIHERNSKYFTKTEKINIVKKNYMNKNDNYNT